MPAIVSRPMLRRWLHAGIAALIVGAAPARAQTTAFDLAGPSLRATVAHGGVTLPLGQVPNLSAGDRVHIAADLPAEQGARYRMVLAFLRGATNPPPKDWLFDAQTWRPKRATIDAVVPEGAEQAVVLLVPETGGALAAVTAAIRGRPGAFVRASQELNQAMLDRARLAAFVERVRRRDPAELAQVSPQLAQSLAVKLDTDCLLRQSDARAACLTQGSNAAVLADGQTSSIAQTLAGTPADIALQLSSTPQAGFGYYSPYIGVIRDVARILGAFQSAQLQFIPALSVQHDATTALLLNAVPSFRKPQSVLVATLPGVAPPALPPLAVREHTPLCASRPGLVLPVVGAPLVFATDYARQMALRVTTRAGVVEMPVHADPAQGGYVVETAPAGVALDAEMQGVLHGLWGFEPFDGPSFRLVAPAARQWSAGDASLVVGRETPLLLSGGAVACVETVTMERDGETQPVAWSAQGADGLALKVPLAGVKPGPVTILVRSYGVAQPQRLTLRAYAEAGQVSGFTLHAGDREGVLTGTRLDQVARLEMGGAVFRPGALGRVGGTDRLTLTTDTAAVGAFQPGDVRMAQVVLGDGRATPLRVTVASSRPNATLVARSVERAAAPMPVVLTLPGDDLVPQDARLVFSLRGQGGTHFAPRDTVEVEASDTGEHASLPLRLQDSHVAIAELDPRTALGESAHGPLRFRVVQDGTAGDWQPLATLVRLPRLTAVTCAVTGPCTLSGTGLFLVQAVWSAGDPQKRTVVPDGYTGTTISVPRAAEGRLALTLRDALQAEVRVATTK